MKRFIVLSSFISFTIACYLIKFGVVRQLVDKDLLKIILEYNFIIILTGLGVITAGNIGSFMVQRAQVAAGKLTNLNQTDAKPISVDEPDDNAEVPKI